MTRTYTALLRGDRLEWTGPAPDPLPYEQARAVTVVFEESSADLPADPSLANPELRRLGIEALKRLAERGTFSEIDDAVEWQREIRKDRPLSGREP